MIWRDQTPSLLLIVATLLTLGGGVLRSGRVLRERGLKPGFLLGRE
jgi:hypothetical protein